MLLTILITSELSILLKMKYLNFFIGVILVAAFVSAVTWSPQGDIDLKSRYNILNGTNATFINIQGNLPWTNLSSYPVACPSGTYLTQLNDSITCTSISAASYNNLTVNNLTASEINNILYVQFGNASD